MTVDRGRPRLCLQRFTVDLAPVVLFVYGRPQHTLRTLQALAANHLADRTELIVYADGPRAQATAEQLQRIAEVRQIIRQRKWCGKLQLHEASFNRGLADSIIAGVTEVTAKYGRAIVLEDDLETSGGFLKFMNEALQVYQADDRVMQICGFNFSAGLFPPKTGFLRASHPWGWATWDRAWRHYNNDARHLLDQVLLNGPDRFRLDGCSFHLDELRENAEGRLKTWAVRWYGSVFLRNGLCLYPGRSLVRNIGFDGSGENCDAATHVYDRIPMTDSVPVQRCPIVESSGILRAHQKHYQSELKRWTGNTLRQRVVRKLVRLLRLQVAQIPPAPTGSN